MNATRSSRRLPLWFKLAYTAFVAVLVPVYCYAYGPTNFLYYCDVALLMTCAALWLESPLLASAPAVGILLPQALWMVDFLYRLLLQRPLTGMTDYMFRIDGPWTLFVRFLSFFHFWLPIVLVYLVFRLGYDRRALPLWTVLAWALMLVCYFFMPPPEPNPGDKPVNINYVYGMDDTTAQKEMAAPAWLALLMVALPVVIYLPTHLLLRWLCPAARTAAGPGAASAAPAEAVV